MSNKTQLQLNNETLDSILSNVLGLPSQESLKHGAYVWKKYTTTPIYVENSSEFYQKVVITESQNAAITYEFSTTYTFDENTGLFTLGSGGGIRIAYDSSGKIDEPSKYYMIGTRTGTTMYKNDGSSSLPTLYNNAGGVTILAYNDSHLVTEYQSELIHEKSDFVDFVVSDSPTTYPDGGEQGGYWYEKVVEGMPLEILGCTKFAIDSITFSADTADTDLYLQHSLGEIPKFAILISDATLFTTNICVMSFILKQGRKHWYGVFEYSFGSDNATIASYNTTSDGYHTAEKIRVQQSGTVRYFRAGVEYTLITMA